MHSVRIELTKLILVGTRIIYQATEDAGLQGLDMIDTTTRKNTKATVSCLLKKEKAEEAPVCLHKTHYYYMRFKHEVKFSERRSQNRAGHRCNAACSHHYLFNL